MNKVKKAKILASINGSNYRTNTQQLNMGLGYCAVKCLRYNVSAGPLGNM